MEEKTKKTEFENQRFELSREELEQGFIIVEGQKTTRGIEMLCKEAESATNAIRKNQYY